jgi:hypothetical protein
MKLTIQLTPETEAKLRDQAALVGKAPEELALEALEERLAATVSGPTAVPAEQWVADFRAWAEGHRRLLHEADDSRESIYAGRGE